MINLKSIKAVGQAKFSKQFIKPLYESYCFSNIPQTIKNILTAEDKTALPKDVLENLPQTYDKVVLFLVDGFGWKYFERYANKNSFLKYAIEKGTVSQLTAQYPSTTAAEVTTIHTGLPVGKSGVYEWFYYEPKADAVIAPLLFSFAGEKERENLVLAGIDSRDIFPKQTIYEDLRKQGVSSYVFQHKEYVNTSYNNIMLRGAEVVPYISLSEALINLSDKLLNEENRSYYFMYFDGIDKIAHRYGPESKQFEAEIDAFLYNMEKFFLKELQGKLHKTLFVMTADHGYASIDPKTTVYLNKDFPQIKGWIKKNKKGNLIVPAGSCRNMVLHIKESSLNSAHTFLSDALVGKAEIYKIEDLANQHFFCLEKPSDVFFEKIGNLAILPYNNESVWWDENGDFEIKYYGHHGGMTPEEMKTMFICLPFSS
ncbi:MAG: alkaline phosphatase family protein [Candidatus Paceibacterota bacterium]|jgi:predicted AlkP superfamily pyrophosphatase or phosphodiesterase